MFRSTLLLLLIIGLATAKISYTSQDGVLKINGKRFYLKGASWFGFETNVSAFHGLWAVDYKFIVDFLANNHFNAVRIPFYLDLVILNPEPKSINYGYCQNDINCNIDLKGLKSLEVLDKIINYMGTKGIVVMLDMHSFEPDAFAQNGLWYDDSHAEQLVISGWQKLVERYKNTWNVFAIDVKNEPFKGTWNTGNKQTDFDAASKRIGDLIVKQTNWLVFIEGTAGSPPCTDACFYGENLQGVAKASVQLAEANRVVYSPHVYGPNVFNQPYFSSADFPANMPKIWDTHFGFIKDRKQEATVVGEWGGSTSGQNGVWLNAFVNYLKAKDMTDNFFWCVNPNSGDTGGLLNYDWMTPDTKKLEFLATLVSNPTKIVNSVESFLSE